MSTIPHELLMRAEAIKQKGDRLCEEIKTSEAFLQSFPNVPAISGDLRWGSERRIMIGDKPLIESKYHVRVEYATKVPALVLAVVEAAERALSEDQS